MSEHVPAPLDDELWWLSFCDADRPAGSQFLGVAIVTAPAALQAVRRAWEIGVNPGGQVQIVGPMPLGSIGPEWCDRLLTREEAENVPPPAWAV